jgi:hypothetical protein
MTAFEVPGQRVALVSGADLTIAKRYKALVVNSSGEVVIAGANAVICGVNQREAKLKEAASVMINGVTFGYLGAAVATGANVSTDANGDFITAVAGPIVGVCVFGGASGALGSILLKERRGTQMPQRSQTHIDAALTNLSVAYMQSADNFIADKVFPKVPVQKQSDRYFAYLKEDWFRDEARERAAGSESAGGDYEIDNTPSYFCKKYAYHKDVTEDDRVNSDSPLAPDQDASDFVSQKLLLRRELAWATSYFKAGVWGNELTGGASNDATHLVKWSTSTSTPVVDVDEAKTTIGSTTGYTPNIMVVGPYVFDALKNHPEILDRIKYTQRGIVTTDLLAMLFGVDQFLVAKAVINTASKGAVANTNYLFGSHALLAYAPPRPALKTPSAGYIFTWTGLMGAGSYGNRIVRLPMDQLGLGTERIEGEMAFDMKVVGTDLGFFFNTIV